MLIGFLHNVRPWILFDKDPGSGGGGAAGDPPAGDPPAGDPPADDGKGQDKDPSTGDDAKVTHTQADLNKLMGTARAEGRGAAQKAILEKAGFKTLGELEAAIADHKKSVDDKKSDIQKAQDAAAAANLEKDRLAAENAELKLQRRFEGGVNDLDLEFVNSDAALDAFEILKKNSEIGPNKDDMAKAIKDLAKSRPYLFGKVEHKDNDSKDKGKDPSTITAERDQSLRQRFRLPAARPPAGS